MKASDKIMRDLISSSFTAGSELNLSRMLLMSGDVLSGDGWLAFIAVWYC